MDNTITLYHGSDHVVEKPQFGFGNPRNDYGLGFYCTEAEDMAAEWAVGSGEDGFVNAYAFDADGLEIIDLEGGEYCALHWLAVLLDHRAFDIRAPLPVETREYLTSVFHVSLDKADVVLGYRADDSYFTFAQDFISGAISYRQLTRSMSLGELGRQVMVKSPRAFERLRFAGFQKAPANVWLPRREERDRLARRDYFDVERNKRQSGDIFIAHILDDEMGPGDARLQNQRVERGPKTRQTEGVSKKAPKRKGPGDACV